MKSYLSAKLLSVILERISIFKLASFQHRAISSFKVLLLIENMEIKEFIPPDRPGNINLVVLKPSKS